MPVPRFLSAGEVFAGRGSLAALRALDAVKAAVVCCRSLLRDPETAKKVTGAVNAHEVRLIEVPTGEPSFPKLRPAMEEVAAFQPDWIVAVGGGSVIDAGKLLWIFHEHPDTSLERIARPFTLPALRGKTRFVAVPTTAGTGSEVSSSAILTDDSGRKIPIVSHELLPDVAVLDPALTVGVPRPVLAAAGLDALAHVLEGYVSRFANPLADTFAETAARTLFAQLPATIEKPEDPDIRLEVMQAAMMGGWVQNLKVPGVGHAIAHQFGRFGVAHGSACGALLAPAMSFNVGVDAARVKYDRLGALLGFKDSAGLQAAVVGLRRMVGAEGGLGELVPGGAAAVRARRQEVVDGALADICARANPRTVDAAAVEAVLAAAL
jgi:alcohol dehydrogenase class IV